MATRSAAKAHRQSLKKRLRNRQIRSVTKSTVKQAVNSIASGNMDTARDDVRIAISALDRTASKGVVHPNNAARRKSRLLLRYNAAVAALQTTTAEEPKQPTKRKPAQRKPAQRKPAQRRTSRTTSAKKAKT